MPRRCKNERYLKVRRWVDRDLVDYPRHSIALQGGFLALMLLALAAYAGGLVTIIAFWLMIFPVGAAWLGFVFWRAYRLSQAATIRNDRLYDQKAKFMLPHEYATTESVSAASRRKRRKASRPSTTA